MQSRYLVAPHRLELRDVPAPVLEGPAQALVRPLAVARCDLDLAFVRGDVPVSSPFALGHECAWRAAGDMR